MVESTGLENRRAARHRGFESHSLRHPRLRGGNVIEAPRNWATRRGAAAEACRPSREVPGAHGALHTRTRNFSLEHLSDANLRRSG